MSKKQTYVILGSNGFVGKKLVETLIDQEIRLIPRDMYCDFYGLKDYLEKINPDYIINCSAYGNMSFQNDIDAIYQINVINSLNLLQASKDLNYKSLILIGSSSEYGEKSNKMKESDLPETNTFYGASKVAQTYLGIAYAQQFDKPIKIVRPFSIYGEGEAEFRFIPTIIKSIETGEQFNLVKEPKHDWIYIDDFISGLLKICHCDKVGIFNIGTGKQYSNIQVVEMLEKIIGKKANYKEIKSLRNFDLQNWVADNSRLKSMEWKPRSLMQGLKKTYENN